MHLNQINCLLLIIFFLWIVTGSGNAARRACAVLDRASLSAAVLNVTSAVALCQMKVFCLWIVTVFPILYRIIVINWAVIFRCANFKFGLWTWTRHFIIHHSQLGSVILFQQLFLTLKTTVKTQMSGSNLIIPFLLANQFCRIHERVDDTAGFAW